MSGASIFNLIAPLIGQSSQVSFLSTSLVFPLRDISKRSRYSKLFAFTSNDLKIGMNIVVDGVPWKVLEFHHLQSGRGAASVRAKIRNQITGTTIEKKFRAACPLKEAVMMRETRQYSYKDGSEYVFMDMRTFEETRLTEKEIGNNHRWLKEGTECQVMIWNGKVMGVQLPSTVKLAVSETGVASSRGDGGGSKPATLETGGVVQVPLFVDVGNVIIVDTESGKYISRT